ARWGRTSPWRPLHSATFTPPGPKVQASAALLCYRMISAIHSTACFRGDPLCPSCYKWDRTVANSGCVTWFQRRADLPLRGRLERLVTLWSLSMREWWVMAADGMHSAAGRTSSQIPVTEVILTPEQERRASA